MRSSHLVARQQQPLGFSTRAVVAAIGRLQPTSGSRARAAQSRLHPFVNFLDAAPFGLRGYDTIQNTSARSKRVDVHAVSVTVISMFTMRTMCSVLFTESSAYDRSLVLFTCNGALDSAESSDVRRTARRDFAGEN
jgi:hypothetical protein